MQLTDEQKTAYREQGFVALPKILDDDEITWQRDTFDRLFTPPADGSKAPFYDLTGNDPDAEMDESAVPQLLHPSHHIPELSARQAWQITLDIAEQLFDMGDCKRDDLIMRDHMIVKPPHSTGATPWHQDEAYWEEDLRYQELSVWFALQETTVEMGCMQFIPGSHLGEINPHHTWKNDPKIIALEIDDGFVDESKITPCPLPAGGATIHNARTMHFTTGNTTDEPRRALILTVGTPPTKLDQPRDFYWNKRDRHYSDHVKEK